MSSSALDIFRFVLATMVVAEHTWYTKFTHSGETAVQAFFVISGFLVTLIATGQYKDRPWSYLLNRFLRIYPTYWACLAVTIPIAVFIGANQWSPHMAFSTNPLAE